MTHPLLDIPAAFHKGEPRGITSVCSAHPMVIEAALGLARALDRPALIEATCNQVNQEGGYTGMTPGDFRRFVERIAEDVGYDPANIILGGDHLGPNPWKHLPADEAMAKAEAMIAAYSEAGFTKLHLDASMGCAGEPAALSDSQTASRAARLAAAAEAHKAGDNAPVYVIGTEVPVPGGAMEELDHLQVTDPGAVAQTYEIHLQAFAELGLQEAFARVIALVVQPGVEFGHTDIVQFDRQKAQTLSDALKHMPGLVFEAHSTDYQSETALRELVQDGYAILKVGPWLTFALREALYALDGIADILDGHPPKGALMSAMEQAMQDAPAHWDKYYSGTERQRWLQRHFSLSDRIRYYWPSPKAISAIDGLLTRLADTEIPAPVLSQFLSDQQPAASGCDARSAVKLAIQNVLNKYESAVAPSAKAVI